MGQRADLIAALVGLERTISPAITVYALRPMVMTGPPAIYNWVLPSPASVPATMTVEDEFNIAVRLVMPTADSDREMALALGYADELADLLDADFMYPAQSALRNIAYEATRGSSRTFTDMFDFLPYLAWEFVVTATLRKIIPLS